MLLKTFIINHKVSLERGLCHTCWSGQVDVCRCGGFIHNEYELIYDDDVILNYECDRCGDNWDLPQREPNTR